MLMFCDHPHLLENGTAFASTVWKRFPVPGQLWGTLSSKFGCAAYLVPCVTLTCAVCNATLFFEQKRPPVQIAWVQLWVWGRELVPRQAFLSCLLFRMPFLLFFPIKKKCWCVCSNSVLVYTVPGTYLCISSGLHGSSQLLPSLCRDRFDKYCYHPSLGACAVRHACMSRASRVHVPCVTRACVLCDAQCSFFFIKT